MTTPLSECCTKAIEDENLEPKNQSSSWPNLKKLRNPIGSYLASSAMSLIGRKIVGGIPSGNPHNVGLAEYYPHNSSTDLLIGALMKLTMFSNASFTMKQELFNEPGIKGWVQAYLLERIGGVRTDRKNENKNENENKQTQKQELFDEPGIKGWLQAYLLERIGGVRTDRKNENKNENENQQTQSLGELIKNQGRILVHSLEGSRDPVRCKTGGGWIAANSGKEVLFFYIGPDQQISFSNPIPVPDDLKSTKKEEKTQELANYFNKQAIEFFKRFPNGGDYSKKASPLRFTEEPEVKTSQDPTSQAVLDKLKARLASSSGLTRNDRQTNRFSSSSSPELLRFLKQTANAHKQLRSQLDLNSAEIKKLKNPTLKLTLNKLISCKDENLTTFKLEAYGILAEMTLNSIADNLWLKANLRHRMGKSIFTDTTFAEFRDSCRDFQVWRTALGLKQRDLEMKYEDLATIEYSTFKKILKKLDQNPKFNTYEDSQRELIDIDYLRMADPEITEIADNVFHKVEGIEEFNKDKKPAVILREHDQATWKPTHLFLQALGLLRGVVPSVAPHRMITSIPGHLGLRTKFWTTVTKSIYNRFKGKPDETPLNKMGATMISKEAILEGKLPAVTRSGVDTVIFPGGIKAATDSTLNKAGLELDSQTGEYKLAPKSTVEKYWAEALGLQSYFQLKPNDRPPFHLNSAPLNHYAIYNNERYYEQLKDIPVIGPIIGATKHGKLPFPNVDLALSSGNIFNFADIPILEYISHEIEFPNQEKKESITAYNRRCMEFAASKMTRFQAYAKERNLIKCLPFLKTWQKSTNIHCQDITELRKSIEKYLKDNKKNRLKRDLRHDVPTERNLQLSTLHHKLGMFFRSHREAVKLHYIETKNIYPLDREYVPQKKTQA